MMVNQLRVIGKRYRMSANFLIQRVNARGRIKFHREDNRVSEHNFMLDENSDHDSNKGDVEKQSVQVVIGNKITEILL